MEGPLKSADEEGENQAWFVDRLIHMLAEG